MKSTLDRKIVFEKTILETFINRLKGLQQAWRRGMKKKKIDFHFFLSFYYFIVAITKQLLVPTERIKKMRVGSIIYSYRLLVCRHNVFWYDFVSGQSQDKRWGLMVTWIISFSFGSLCSMTSNSNLYEILINFDFRHVCD